MRTVAVAVLQMFVLRAAPMGGQRRQKLEESYAANREGARRALPPGVRPDGVLCRLS